MLPNVSHSSSPAAHVPVLAHEVDEVLDLRPGDTVVDCTFGAGGHAAVLEPRLAGRGTYVAIDRDPDIKLVRVSNEADLPGIVAGAYLGGARALMIMENSGLRQACEPIARFAFAHHVPLVMVVSYRGDFGEKNWWGHNHAQVMQPLLEALRIPLRVVDRIDQLRPSIAKAFDHSIASQWPVCLALTGECTEGAIDATP